MIKYDPAKIEKKWQKHWAESGIYKNYDRSKKFYVLDMFPYPSGVGLHVGHPKGYIATDVVARMKMLQGFSVLHPMGWDAFGLPAENYAIKNKSNPNIFTAKSVATYKKQLEMFGFTYDWDREINTTDPAYYKWTQWIFLKLFEKGLAYESNEPINWCPSCKTGLSNEDLEDGKCERCGSEVEQRPMRQWVLKMTAYADRLLADLDSPELDWEEMIVEQQKNWIGRSEGAQFSLPIAGTDEKIEVYTTRLDTVFGMTYAVVAPEHGIIRQLADKIENYSEIEEYISKANKKTALERTELQKEKTGAELKGIKIINPFNGEKLPLYVADYVLGNYGTGAVMAVPAHDERDFEFAHKYDLPIVQSIAPYHFDQDNPPQEGKENTVRRVVHVALENDRGEFLTLNLKGEKWGNNRPKTLIVGGIEGEEKPEEAALREVQEETGYTDVEVVKVYPIEIHAEFYAAHKELNRYVKTIGVICKLRSEKQVPVSEEEKVLRDLVWVERKALPVSVTIPDDVFLAKAILENRDSFTQDGVVVNSQGYTGMKSDEARQKMMDWLEKEGIGKRKVNYKMRDWVYSRQRYWGEPIPIIHCEKCGAVGVPEDQLPVRLPDVENYEPTGTGESPLAAITDWVNVPCPKCGGPAKRETNTMPQWGGSSWYYLRYIDPKNDKFLIDKELEKEWMPVDLYVGGAEHATRHLLYARFWHKFLFDIGAVSTIEPFKKLVHVGLIMAEDGRKMSKRWNNVINPDEVIKEFGADSMRMYEMFMGPFTQSCAWSTAGVSGVRRFLEKVWRLQEKIVAKKDSDKISGAGIFLEVESNKFLFSVRDESARIASGSMAFWGGGKEGDESPERCAVRELEEELGLAVKEEELGFVGDVLSPDETKGNWDRFFVLDAKKAADENKGHWPVREGKGSAVLQMDAAIGDERVDMRTREILRQIKAGRKIKNILHKTIKKVSDDIENFRFNTAISAMMILVNEMEKQEKISASDYNLLITILSPFAPHVAEELWNKLGEKSSIFSGVWPEFDSSLIQDEEISMAVQFNGKTRGTILVSPEVTQDEAKEKVLVDEKLQKHLAGKEIKKVVFVKGRLVNFVVF